jgi:hypothetical protein
MKRGGSIGHGQLILSAVVRDRFLLYVPFVLGRTKSIFLEILYSDRRLDDEDGQFVRLNLGEVPSNREKAQRSDPVKILDCVTALSFFQAVYFSA